jgi:hypothetical protein
MAASELLYTLLNWLWLGAAGYLAGYIWRTGQQRRSKPAEADAADAGGTAQLDASPAQRGLPAAPSATAAPAPAPRAAPPEPAAAPAPAPVAEREPAAAAADACCAQEECCRSGEPAADCCKAAAASQPQPEEQQEQEEQGAEAQAGAAPVTASGGRCAAPPPQPLPAAASAPRDMLPPPPPHDPPPPPAALQGKVLYASVTGTSRRLAAGFVQAYEKAQAALAAASPAGELQLQLQLQDLASYEVEALLGEQLVLLVLPTHQGGTPPPAAAWFCRCAPGNCAPGAPAALRAASLLPLLPPAALTPAACPLPRPLPPGGWRRRPATSD